MDRKEEQLKPGLTLPEVMQPASQPQSRPDTAASLWNTRSSLHQAGGLSLCGATTPTVSVHVGPCGAFLTRDLVTKM